MSEAIPGTARFLRGAVGAFLALAVVAAPGLAQVTEQQDRHHELASELHEIQLRLDQVEQQALQDPELQQQRTELQQQVGEAIRDVDPNSEQKMERLETLQDDLHEAQQEGDREQVQLLLAELQTIQAELEHTRVQVMQDPDVVREMESFRSNLVSAMTEIDPETPQLLQRMEELQAELGIGAQ